MNYSSSLHCWAEVVKGRSCQYYSSSSFAFSSASQASSFSARLLSLISTGHLLRDNDLFHSFFSGLCDRLRWPQLAISGARMIDDAGTPPSHPRTQEAEMAWQWYWQLRLGFKGAVWLYGADRWCLCPQQTGSFQPVMGF